MTLNPAYFRIDPASAMPRYAQIQDNLAELVEVGLLKAGDVLPSERDLSEMYGVSRLTVRQALQALTSRGLLHTQHGVGTFVLPPRPKANLAPTVTGFSQRMREAGMTPTSQLLQAELHPATPVLRHRLALGADEKVLCLRRLRLADDEPLILETSFLPAARFAGLTAHDLEQQSLYHLLETQYGVQVAATEQTLEPTLLQADEVAHLKQPEGSPAMLVRIVAYDQDQTPVEYSKSVVRGDRCRYYFRVNTHLPLLS